MASLTSVRLCSGCRARRAGVAVRCSARPPPMRDAQGAPNTAQMLVFVPPHPLLKHWLAVARSSATPPQLFRSALAELGRLLIYEARPVSLRGFAARADAAPGWPRLAARAGGRGGDATGSCGR